MDREFWKSRDVIVTGGRGFLGRHLAERLMDLGARIFPVDSRLFDLRDRKAVNLLILPTHHPRCIIFHLAARVSGIGAIAEKPATMLHDNLVMGLHVLEAAVQSGNVEKVIIAGSVCAYPERCPQPMIEKNLWEGYPEETNSFYGIAKRTLAVAAEAYSKQYGLAVLFPLLANMYGPGDSLDLRKSHVIPALMQRMIAARNNDDHEIVVWGTGQVSRDFLYVEDAVEALVLIGERMDTPNPINIGTGVEVTISGLARMIRKVVGFEGDIVYDFSKPDGQPRRCLQTREAERRLGWKATTTLEVGLQKTYEWMAPIVESQIAGVR